jgi:DHA2 family multidrug resistance protein-like MFS transporter
VLIEWFDWSAVFLVNVPIALAAVLLGLRLVPESRDPDPGAFDVVGAALSTAGFSALVYAVIEAPEHGWASGLIVGLLSAAAALLVAFVWWERRVAQPMLDLRLFRNAQFSVGTLAVSVAFFSLLGGIFALTQYLQFAHGYSAIEAGAVMTPLALGLIMGAGSSSKAVERVGTGPVVAAGLSGLALVLSATLLWSPDTHLGVLLPWVFLLALSMGWVMAPATEAVVSSVPAAKSGVASAMNTVARMVSGALGVAVVGSRVSSLFADDLAPAVRGLPAPAREAAVESIGAASAVAGDLPSGPGSTLLASAGDAFVDAMAMGLLIGAGLSAIAAVIVMRVLAGRSAEQRPPTPINLGSPARNEV